MTWTVLVLEAMDHKGRTVFDVIATKQEPAPGENPDYFIMTYPDRLKPLVGARRFATERGFPLHEANVVPFPMRGRVA